jgi:hypothetical protein
MDSLHFRHLKESVKSSLSYASFQAKMNTNLKFYLNSLQMKEFNFFICGAIEFSFLRISIFIKSCCFIFNSKQIKSTGFYL